MNTNKKNPLNTGNPLTAKTSAQLVRVIYHETHAAMDCFFAGRSNEGQAHQDHASRLYEVLNFAGCTEELAQLALAHSPEVPLVMDSASFITESDAAIWANMRQRFMTKEAAWCTLLSGSPEQLKLRWTCEFCKQDHNPDRMGMIGGDATGRGDMQCFDCFVAETLES